jgi:small subunit ribosomal protein S16
MIRLQRTGRENLPTYRLVVAEKARPVKGKFLEIIGHYLPARDPVVFEHNDERIAYWIGRGAIPSDTVARMLKRAGLKNMDKFIQKYTKQRSKKELPPEAAAPVAPTSIAEAAPAAETPAQAPAETPAV